MVKNNRRNRPRRRKTLAPDIITVPCKFLVNVTLASGVGLFTIGSGALTNSARFVACSSLFRFYRVTHIETQSFWNGQGSGTATVLFSAFEPGTTTTTPTAIADFEYDCMTCQYIMNATADTSLAYKGSVPPKLVVPRKYILGLQPWYLTDGDGTAENDTIGTMRFASDSATDNGVVKVFVHITFQFKGGMDPAIVGSLLRKYNIAHALTPSNPMPSPTSENNTVVIIDGQSYHKVTKEN